MRLATLSVWFTVFALTLILTSQSSFAQNTNPQPNSYGATEAPVSKEPKPIIAQTVPPQARGKSYASEADARAHCGGNPTVWAARNEKTFYFPRSHKNLFIVGCDGQVIAVQGAQAGELIAYT